MPFYSSTSQKSFARARHRGAIPGQKRSALGLLGGEHLVQMPGERCRIVGDDAVGAKLQGEIKLVAGVGGPGVNLKTSNVRFLGASRGKGPQERVPEPAAYLLGILAYVHQEPVDQQPELEVGRLAMNRLQDAVVKRAEHYRVSRLVLFDHGDQVIGDTLVRPGLVFDLDVEHAPAADQLEHLAQKRNPLIAGVLRARLEQAHRLELVPGLVLEQTLAIGRLGQVAAMDSAMQDDQLARLALLHVEFDAVYASLQAFLEGGKRILRRGRIGPAASAPVSPDVRSCSVVHNLLFAPYLKNRKQAGAQRLKPPRPRFAGIVILTGNHR